MSNKIVKTPENVNEALKAFNAADYVALLNDMEVPYFISTEYKATTHQTGINRLTAFKNLKETFIQLAEQQAQEDKTGQPVSL